MKPPREQVIACLQNYPGCTASFVVYITELPWRVALDTLESLIREGLVGCSPTRVLDGTREVSAVGYSILAEHIGECELCGRHDHHLRAGLCNSCRPRATTIDVHHDGDIRCAELVAEAERLRRGQAAPLPPTDVLKGWRIL